jgi:hypothetical protein
MQIAVGEHGGPQASEIVLGLNAAGGITGSLNPGNHHSARNQAGQQSHTPGDWITSRQPAGGPGNPF